MYVHVPMHVCARVYVHVCVNVCLSVCLLLLKKMTRQEDQKHIFNFVWLNIYHILYA